MAMVGNWTRGKRQGTWREATCDVSVNRFDNRIRVDFWAGENVLTAELTEGDVLKIAAQLDRLRSQTRVQLSWTPRDGMVVERDQMHEANGCVGSLIALVAGGWAVAIDGDESLDYDTSDDLKRAGWRPMTK